MQAYTDGTAIEWADGTASKFFAENEWNKSANTML